MLPPTDSSYACRCLDICAVLVRVVLAQWVQGLRHLTNVAHVHLVLLCVFGPLNVVVERIRLLNCVKDALVERRREIAKRGVSVLKVYVILSGTHMI